MTSDFGLCIGDEMFRLCQYALSRIGGTIIAGVRGIIIKGTSFTIARLEAFFIGVYFIFLWLAAVFLFLAFSVLQFLRFLSALLGTGTGRALVLGFRCIIIRFGFIRFKGWFCSRPRVCVRPYLTSKAVVDINGMVIVHAERVGVGTRHNYCNKEGDGGKVLLLNLIV